MYPLKTLALLLGGILFAFVMEAIQYVLPYRAFNINDLLANGLGVVLGFVLLKLGFIKSFVQNKNIVSEN
jgi:glycopeptide antibiotics resistance protein